MTLPKDQSESRTGVSKGLFYFFIGSGIGAAAALLLAPKSGGELRADISKVASKGYDETKDLADHLKERGDTFETAQYGKTGEIRENPRGSSASTFGRRPSSIL